MRRPVFLRLLSFAISLAIVLGVSLCANAQSNSGTISGTVTDPSGAVVPGASVEINNHVSGYKRTARTDASGQFRFYNIPFNPYRVTATMIATVLPMICRSPVMSGTMSRFGWPSFGGTVTTLPGRGFGI